MKMGVDKAWNQVLACHVDDFTGLVAFADANDYIATNRHVSGQERSGHHIQNGAAAQNQISRDTPTGLIDHVVK